MTKPANLSKHVQDYREFNARLDADQRRQRGSMPPSDPRLPAAHVRLTTERAREIGLKLTASHAVLGVAELLEVSAAELHEFARAAVRGAVQK